MNTLLDDFKYEQYGATTLADAVCAFIKEQITYGRIKGGETLPTMGEIAKKTGLSFYQARNLVERMVREGYVHSKRHVGTVVCSRSKNVLRGRVLIALPDVDTCRYYPVQMIVTMRRRLSEAGYAMAVVSFPLDRQGSLSSLKSELIRAVDLVIVCRATPNVQKCLAESGVRHIFAFGDRPKVRDGSPWLRFSFGESLNQFAVHCKNAGVKHVTQVCFELDELCDASRVLAANGISSSRLTIPCPAEGRNIFYGIMHQACDMFASMSRKGLPDLLLFWNAFAAQGALMGLVDRGIRIPDDVKVVALSNTGFGPVYTKPITRIEADPIEAGVKISDYALAVLESGRFPKPPTIAPQYIFGATFPF